MGCRLAGLGAYVVVLVLAAACSSSAGSSTPSIRCGAGASTSAGCTCTFKGSSSSPVSDCSVKAYPGYICCAYQNWPATTYADTAFCECDPASVLPAGNCGPQQQVSSCSSTTPVLIDAGGGD